MKSGLKRAFMFSVESKIPLQTQVSVTQMEMFNNYLRASSNGDDTSEEIPNHRFQGDRQTIDMDSVDQAQAVLFDQTGYQDHRL